MSNTAVVTMEQPVQVQLQKMEEKFEAALPEHIPATRFTRAAVNALASTDMMQVAQTPAGRKTIFDSCLKAAADGLLLDGREAALVKFNTKVDGQWVNAAQYMPMVAGIMKKARNSGEVGAIFSQVIYSNDEFVVDLVTDGTPIVHRPMIGDRGDVIGVYALAKLKDGTWTQPEIMDIDQVEAIRQRSKAGRDGKTDRNGKPLPPSGPWATDWAEMARKTVIRRAAKYWPSSSDKDGNDWRDVITRDDEELQKVTVQEPAKPKSARELLSVVEPDPEPKPEPRDVIDVSSDDEELPPHDADTGEVIEPEDSEDV